MSLPRRDMTPTIDLAHGTGAVTGPVCACQPRYVGLPPPYASRPGIPPKDYAYNESR